MLLAPDDPWAGYARTVVEIHRPGVGGLVVRAEPRGYSGVWPWSSPAVVHVLTAWDPGDERPGVEVNRARQEALESELQPLARGLWIAAGVDPLTGCGDEGVAVLGLPEAVVLRIAVRYRQSAVFAWTPREWAIVACHGSRRVSLGWSSTSLHDLT